MQINTIEIKNFYSIRDLKLDFRNYSGITLIEGKNLDIGGSNGSGKSAIVEAVVFALFGKTIRKSTEEALVNFSAGKNCSVTLRVNDNIVIKRTKRPTFLSLNVDGVELTKESVNATQELIDSTLNTNYKLFLASVVFGQHNDLDFISATPEEKRVIIRNFLSLENIFQLRDKVKVFKSQYNNQIKTFDALLDEYSQNRTSAIKNIDKIEREKYRVRGWDLSYEACSLSDIYNCEKKQIKLKSELQELEFELQNLSDSMAMLEQGIKKGTYQETGRCPTCKRDMYVTEVNYEQIDKWTKQWEEEKYLWEVTKQKYDEVERQLKEINLPFTSDMYKQIQDLNKLNAERHIFEELKSDLEDKLKITFEKRKDKLRKVEVMKFWEIAFSEQGIIKYVVRNILDYFNEKCNYYLSYLTNGKYIIKFDDSLKEEVIVNGNKTNYLSLSGGEKKKVNIAVLLALQNLLAFSDKSQTNFVFFDEIADYLDNESLDGLYILLQEMKKTKNFFIITHNNYLKSLLDESKRITVVKQKGITKLK